MQPLAGLLVAGIPVDVQTVSPVLAMMAECIGIKIASAARGMVTSYIGGIADEKAVYALNQFRCVGYTDAATSSTSADILFLR
jgi:hypothetical protein